MPRKKKKPELRFHSAVGQYYVRADGQFHYLGVDPAEAQDRYEEFIRDWMRGRDLDRFKLTVDDLCILYLEHCQRYYRKNGKPTSEVSNVKQALRPLIEVHGRTRVRDFDSLGLMEVQERMIELGIVRTSINRHTSRIKAMFKWAAARKHAPSSVYYDLRAVSGLEKDRTDAIEPEPVRPVPDDVLEATLPHMPTPVRAMVGLQILTGMRPGEVMAMRGCDLTMSGEVWEYVPDAHKTEHHDKDRVIFLGPKAQAIVRAYLMTDLQAYLFSPEDAKREADERRKANRNTPMTPSQRQRKPKPNPKRRPGKRYTKDSYRRAVERACEVAFGMPKELRHIPKKLPQAKREKLKEQAREWRRQHCWNPHRLRHNAGTAVRKRFGIEAAKTILGHSSVATSERLSGNWSIHNSLNCR